MRGRLELVFYVAVGAGMALATSSFMMVAGLFEVATTFWVLVALVLAGIACSVIALSIGELAGMFPSSPGVRTYFKSAFGNRASLTLIYLYFAFLILIAGVESYVFALVMRALVPGVSPTWIVVALFVAVTVTNLAGLQLPRGVQMATAFASVTIILSVGAVGLGVSPPSAADAFAVGSVGAGIATLPATVGLAVFLFMGFEWVTPLGLRPDSYQRRIPLSMPLAIGALVLTYLFFGAGLAANLPRGTIATDLTPQVPYFTAVLGDAGVQLAGLLSLTAIVSTFNAGLMGGSRLISVMSRDGSLPAWCGRMSIRTGAPVGAVLVLGSLAMGSSLAILTLDLEFVAAVIGASIICLIYSGYMAAVLRLRRSMPDRPRPFRTMLPRAAQWAMIVALLVVAVATLFSMPDLGVLPLAGMVAATALAAALSHWSVRRGRDRAQALR